MFPCPRLLMHKEGNPPSRGCSSAAATLDVETDAGFSLPFLHTRHHLPKQHVLRLHITLPLPSLRQQPPIRILSTVPVHAIRSILHISVLVLFPELKSSAKLRERHISNCYPLQGPASGDEVRKKKAYLTPETVCLARL
jgi:hypothetical protein